MALAGVAVGGAGVSASAVGSGVTVAWPVAESMSGRRIQAHNKNGKTKTMLNRRRSIRPTLGEMVAPV